MRRIAIERLCVFGMPPLEFVALAAQLGCSYIAIGLESPRYNPHGYSPWSLRHDAVLRREMAAALREQEVAISLYDAVGLKADCDFGTIRSDLEVLTELGVARMNIASIDRDRNRAFDQFAAVAELGFTFGIETAIEIGIGPLATLTDALAAAHHVGKSYFRLLIDTMHYFRLGGTVEAIAAMDSSLIGYVQLCDVPLVSKHARYMDEALYERLPPGTGELPLADFLGRIPRDVVIGIEVPQRSLAEAGVGPRDRVAGCLEATRRLLQQVDGIK
jgi:sugar phosphate isomerase/epimerase